MTATHLQLLRGPSTQEQGITGYEGEPRVDLDRMTLRIHDGVTQGGFELPNVDLVRSMIALGQGDSTDVGEITFYTTEDSMIAAVPNASTLAIVIEDGFEDIYRWHAGVGDDGDIPSGIDGYWKRVASQTSEIVRLWRLGQIDVQFGGTEPIADQDTLLWLTSAGVVLLWDGADYVVATPELWARMYGHIGGYSTETFVLPNRLLDTLVEVADADLAVDSGWYKSAVAATNMPVAGVHPIEMRKLSATVAIQIVRVQGSATLTKYVRFKSTTWGSWTSADDVLPDRLAATSGTVADANSATESGFYQINAAASNIPTAEKGTLTVVRYSATAMTQVWLSTDAAKMYTRRMLASAWSAWTPVLLGYADIAAISAALTAFMKLVGGQTVTGGFNLTPYSLGTIASFTANPLNGNYQYGTNNGAFTLTAPASDCAIDILITNGASAGAITFSGFTVSATSLGDPLTTTNTNKHLITIVRINGVSTYVNKALQ